MNIFKRVLRIISYVFIVLATFGLILCCASSDVLETNKITVKNSNISGTVKAVVISDYHHRSLKFSNGNLIDKVNEENPDVIFFIGDMVDQHTKDLSDLTKMFDAFKDKQMFYVTGNHEQYAPLWTDGSVKKLMSQKKVNYLSNGYVDISANIRVFGVDDPKFSNPNEPYFGKNYGDLEKKFEAFKKAGAFADHYNVLLAHRPELMDLYSKYDFDYVISGHTHGGQIKFFNAWTPIITGQGFNPKYVSGSYTENNTTMYVTKGLGHSAMLPIRVHCNPEILSITFTK